MRLNVLFYRAYGEVLYELLLFYLVSFVIYVSCAYKNHATQISTSSLVRRDVMSCGFEVLKSLLDRLVF